MNPAEARDSGAELALEAEPRKFQLEWALSEAAKSFPIFSSDEVWGLLAEIGVYSLEHPNALGAQFLCAARAGIIENTGRVQKSDRTRSNRRAIAIWQSKIFGSITVKPTVSTNPISNFFLNEVSPACGTAIGRAYAQAMVATLKRDHTQTDLSTLLGYLLAWNDRSSAPFTEDEIRELVKIEPFRKPKRAPRPEPEAFATRLLDTGTE